MPDTIVRHTRHNGSIVELPISFLGPDQNFVLKTDPIERRMSAEIGPRLLDLLEIASAIFCADSSFSRGDLTQPREGRTWRRQLEFEFAVRDPGFWAQPDMTRLLRETTEFMTDDDISLRFVPSEYSPNPQAYIDFNSEADDAFSVDDVILFSGGLDSLAGTLETLAVADRRVALVTHRSAPKTMRQQDDLINRLGNSFGDRFLWVPVQVHRRGKPARESTQRSRSLLFAALGCVVAQMLGASSLKFFENGIVSQNLPLARPIAGTLATRTTHPRTLRSLQTLLSQATGNVFSVLNDFEWETKSEVVKRLSRLGHTDLVPLTVSCNHTFKRQSKVRHCGSCSQCLDRRFAMLANGLGDVDRGDDYATDVLFGTRDRDEDQALVVEWVRHARRLAGMDRHEFFRVFANEVLRVADAYDDRKASIQRSNDLHRKHGNSVIKVLGELQKSEIMDAPPASIAALFGNQFVVPEESKKLPANELEVDLAKAPVAFDPDSRILEIRQGNNSNIAVLGLQDLAGPKARIVSCLLNILIEDRASGVPIAKFRTLKAREIADLIGVSEDYVRQEVRRIRRELRDSWHAIHGDEPPRELLIQTRGKSGYRLDPTVNVVASELDQSG